MDDLQKRVEELERQVRDLQARPVYVPYPVPAPSPVPWPPTPTVPWPTPGWPPFTVTS